MQPLHRLLRRTAKRHDVFLIVIRRELSLPFSAGPLARSIGAAVRLPGGDDEEAAHVPTVRQVSYSKISANLRLTGYLYPQELAP